jgi:hypothetical protein
LSKHSTLNDLLDNLCISASKRLDIPIASERDLEADREDRERKIAILREAQRKFGYEPSPRRPPARTDEELLERIQEACKYFREQTEENRQVAARRAEAFLKEASTPDSTEHPDSNVEAQLRAQAAHSPQVVRRKPAPGSGHLDDYKSHSLDEQFAEARRLNRLVEEDNFDF